MVCTVDQIADAFSSELIPEADAQRFLMRFIRPSLQCPSCGRSFDGREVERLYADVCVRCTCGRKSSARSGTIIDGVHAGWSQILMIFVLRHFGLNDHLVAAKCNVSHDTVSRIYRRFAEAVE